MLTACHVAERRRRENDDAFTGVTAITVQDDKHFREALKNAVASWSAAANGVRRRFHRDMDEWSGKGHS